MKWHKLGLIFKPDKKLYWQQGHAALPFAVHFRDDIFRIYYSSRDKENRSHVGYVEIDIKEPHKLLFTTKKPILNPGPLGCFDDHGVYASSIVDYRGKKYMYYIGWNPGKVEPLFYSSIGLAISIDGGVTFKKFSSAPIFARSEYDPCLVTSPFVMIKNGFWRMWYVSGYQWEWENHQAHSYYHVKYAESEDGINWQRKGVICIDHSSKEEKNIARPYVIKERGLYKMWYSFDKGKGYRIGYAESKDGIKWERKDGEAGINVSKSGWDSQTIAYPSVFTHKGKKYILYCGNKHGKDGFGLAVSG